MPSAGVAAKIAAVAGDGQSGVVGSVLPDSLVVRVTDSKDRPVEGQQVSFTVTAGGGTVVPPSATTNSDGRASARWSLGPTAGSQTVVAKAVGGGAPANLSVTFTATALAAAPAKLEKVAGDGQTAPAGSPVQTPPAVKVTDAQGNPVAGVLVTFAVTQGGGSINPTTPVATGSGGVAALTSWTLGARAGSNQLTATIPGSGVSGNPATFTATGVVGGANKLVFVVQPANVAVGAPIAPAVKVQVQDAAGNVVSGATNRITVQLGNNPTGASLSGTTSVNAAGGTATFSDLSVNKPGTGYTLAALASGLVSAESASFDVVGAQTTTSITGISPGTTVVGQSYTVSFTVSPVPPASGIPTGTVTVSDGAGASCSAAAPSGSCALASTSAGPKTVTAAYGGDASFGGSVSPGVSHSVNPAPTVTTITGDDPDPSVFGQPVTVSYTVAVTGGGSGTPDGTVTVTYAAGGGCTGTVASGQCSFVPPATATNASLTAQYQGSANFSGSTSPAVRHTVTKASTTTGVTSSKNPSGFGESVTFTATVTAVAPGGGTPGGSIQFRIDGNNADGPVPLNNGSATLTTSTLTPGSHSVEAVYGGATGYNGSTGTLTQQVGLIPTSTTLTTSPSSSVFGQNVTLTAQVTSSAGSPTGDVRFVDGGSCGGTVLATVPLSNGSASISVASLSVGSHTLRACYLGTSTFAASERAAPYSVAQAATQTQVASTANPSVFGQAVSFSAAVTATAPGGGTPLGQVQFKIDGANFGSPVSLSGGTAVSNSTSTLGVGSHTVEADYSGNSSYVSSAGTLSGGETVSPASTTTTITNAADLSNTPTASGNALTVNFSVAVVAPGSGSPSGTVRVSLDSGESCTGSVASGTCTVPPPITAGQRTITASYPGDNSFAPSTSSGVSHLVTP